MESDMFSKTERLLMRKSPMTDDHIAPQILEDLWRDWPEKGQNSHHLGISKNQTPKAQTWIHRATPDITEHYILEDIIGIPGQYGTVRCCVEKKTGNQYAVKKIDKLVYPDPKIRSIFFKDLQLEVIIMNHAKDHENIVQIHEVFEDSKYLFIVMEKLVGGELYDYLQKNRPLAESKAAEVFAQMVNAIYYCHSLNIVHCDIKPENFVFKTKEQSVMKCIDFGMSKISRWRKYFNRMNGTPYYVSPEVLKGQYNEGSDMWSLGVCLFILIYGVPPFFSTKNDKKRATKEVYQKIQNGFYPSVRPGHGPWFPQKVKASTEVRDLIARLLRKNIADRITADEVLTHPWLSATHQRSRSSVDPVLLKSLVGFHNGPKLLHEIIAVLDKIGFLNQHQQEEVMRSQKLMDTNGDGFIQAEELHNILRQVDPDVSSDFVKLIFRIADANHDGALDSNELLSARIYRKAVSKIDRLDKLFRIMDTDGNGIIDAHEIQSVLETCGKSTSRSIQYCKDLIAEIDKDGDGKINYEEFLDVFGVRKNRRLSWQPSSPNMKKMTIE